MTELSSMILNQFQVRKTKKQKIAFIDLLHTHIPQLSVQEGGFPKNRNLIIGDPATAKVILGAHYDTCAQLPFPNFITPKKPIITILYGFLTVIPFFLGIVLLNMLLDLLSGDFLFHYLISICLYAGFMWLMLAGPANRHTANDNTSGVITLLEIYQVLPAAQRDQVCFVFFDNEEKGVIGSAYFRKKFKKVIKNKLLINFDCVSDGDHFLLGISKKANQKYHVAVARAFTSCSGKTVMLENLKKIYYPSDQAGFPMAVTVAALKHKKLIGYYLDRIHTKKDVIFDESNIAFLRDKTLQLIENL